MKTTQQSIDYNSQFLVARGLDPKPDFCDPNPFSTFSSRPTSRLVLNWSSLELISLHLNRTLSRLFIGIRNKLETSRVAARVSLRMAPDACAATPRAPHGWLHDLLTWKVAPHPLPVWMHGLAPCKETPRPPHVWLHGLVACIATPRAWPIHLVLHMSTCMYRFHVLQHLTLSLKHILPGACHHVLNTHTSSHLELLGLLSDIDIPGGVSLGGDWGRGTMVRGAGEGSRLLGRRVVMPGLTGCVVWSNGCNA
ncbi:hypothetical protein F2Q69_00055366 [Brassica cretica]|uniref:Uncharacterized protein n=1 Tax=Brassica cretica TaxID=69181 RepID=A0A8S9MTK1_BRACR|nr:hypothetical protein F2Q69_00055366 [Brassica cretica]